MGPQGGLFDVAAGNPLALPTLVRVISLWWMWAQRVRSGDKTIETRTWPWPYDAGWLAIHAAQRADGDIVGTRVPWAELPPCEAVTPGSLCALVWVAACRPLVESDLGAALIYRPGLKAWCLDSARTRRLRPVPMRGPQKFSSVDRDVIYGALEPLEARAS